MATGDVTLRLEGVEKPQFASGARERKVLVDDHDDAMAVHMGAMTLEDAMKRGQERSIAKEAARQEEKPIPEPWDAWVSQKAPDMFEPEVTHRG